MQRQRDALQRNRRERNEQILRRIRTVLNSAGFRVFRVGAVSIVGGSHGAQIYEVMGSVDWVSPLLTSLREEYRDRKVTACVQWRARHVGSLEAPQQRPLDESDPLKSLMAVREEVGTNGNVAIYICVRVSKK